MGEINSDDLAWKLRELSSEISALGHLIRTQKPEEASQEDLEEMNCGLGVMLRRIARRVRWASREVERRGIEQVRRGSAHNAALRQSKISVS